MATASSASAHRSLDSRPILLVLGILLIILALFMMPPMVADLVIDHPDWKIFLGSSAATAFIGVSLMLVNRSAPGGELTTRQVFLLTSLAWFGVAVFAALPFAVSDLDLTPADAFFEAMSGLTTTGSTVIVGLDDAPPGILLWRSILQWLGGIGIIVMGVAILPILSVGGMQLFRAESSDLSEKILPRAAQLASATGLIYLSITVACAVLYWSAGMDTFDATAHAMTTVATGGFSTHDTSIGYFGSPMIEWTAIVFMLIGGMPFVIYIQAVAGNARALAADAQVRWFLTIALVSAVTIAVFLLINSDLQPMDAVRMSAFHATSLMTGTGYVAADYGLWGHFPIAAFFFLMCVGGCTGSTTGGIKIFRFIVLYEVARSQIARLIQPHGVFPTSYNGRTLPDSAAISVMAFFFLFALSFAVLALLLGLSGLDYLTAMSAALTALANVGPGLGPLIGPVSTFANLEEHVKWLLAVAMLVGRLELFTLFVLVSPAFWRI
ncbi:MAG: TrkH family potassium uptake protein [Geminicoccaceae bacterium]